MRPSKRPRRATRRRAEAVKPLSDAFHCSLARAIENHMRRLHLPDPPQRKPERGVKKKATSPEQ
jgi:hypothetical protein